MIRIISPLLIFVFLITTTMFHSMPLLASGCQGCCSYHGGITSSCYGDRLMCVDGTASPTCSCSCLSSSKSTGGGGGSGGGIDSNTAAAITGATLGVGLASAFIYGLVKGKEISYNRHYERTLRHVKEGTFSEGFKALSVGEYAKGKRSCDYMPDTVYVTRIEDVRSLALENLHAQLKSTKSKSEAKKVKKDISDYEKLTPLHSSCYFVNPANNSVLVGNVFQDGTVAIFDNAHEELLCTGRLDKTTKYKKAVLYCKNNSKFCQAIYRHVSMNKK